MTNCHSNRTALNLPQNGQSEGKGSPPRAVEIPLDQSCWKLTTKNSPGQHFLSIYLPKTLSLSCLIPLESTLGKLVVKKKPHREGSVGFGIVLGFFSSHKINNPPTTCLRWSIEAGGRAGYTSENHITIRTLQSQSLPLPWIQTRTLCLTPLCTSAAEEEGKEMPLKAEVTPASG